MRKHHSMHCKADERNETARGFEDIDAGLREVLDRPRYQVIQYSVSRVGERLQFDIVPFM